MARTKGRYVDGFVLVVPKKNKRAYQRMAADGARLWKKHGALDYKECWGDDLRPKGMGPVPFLTFPKMTRIKPSETVVFSYILYKSRAHRDQVNARVMKDPAMTDPTNAPNAMPFDMKKMAYGGFEVIVDGS